jgi:hypothetical protein
MTQYVALLPPLVACLAYYSLSESVRLAHLHGHVPPEISTPPLSLAGISAPEYYVFAGGLASVSVLLKLMEWLHARIAAPWLALAPPGCESVAGLVTSRFYFTLACAGLAVVGIVPLQGWGAGASLLHVSGSAVFFSFTLAHGRALLSALSTDELAYLPTSQARAPLLWWAKAAVMGSGFLSFIPAQLMHPGEKGVDGGETLDINRGGVSQYWLVASLVVYLTLWGAGDLWLLSSEAPPASPGGDAGAPEELPPLVHESVLAAAAAVGRSVSRGAAAAGAPAKKAWRAAAAAALDASAAGDGDEAPTKKNE